MTLFYENKLNPIGVKLKNAMARSKILKEKKEFEMNKAARVIQKAFRRYLARKKGGRSVFAKKKKFKSESINKKKFKIDELPFFMIQNSGFYEFDNKKTADLANFPQKLNKNGLVQTIVFLQKNIRMFIQHQKYKKLKNSVLLIQKTFKMHQVRKIYLKVRNAIIFIQTTYRKLKCKQKS